MECECGGTLRFIASASSGKREVWRCKKPGCRGEEIVQLYSPILPKSNGSRTTRFEPNDGETEVTVETDGNEGQRRTKMAKTMDMGEIGKGGKTKKGPPPASKIVKDPPKTSKGNKISMKAAKAAKEKIKEKGNGRDLGPPNQCPCCGELTGGPKVFFKMGHDGRVKGWFSKKSKGKLEGIELSDELLKMYGIWKKDPEMKIKDIVKKVRGIK